jgi:hypothetical protein
MPGRDRTGPMGAGSMTGRRAGYCVGSKMPGFSGPVRGYWTRFGGRFSNRGRHHGWRYQCYPTGMPGWLHAGFVPLNREQELVGLKNEAEWHKSQLEIIEKRIGELELEQ